MYQLNSKIIYNKEIAPGHLKIALQCPQIAKSAQPGQFVHVLTGGDTLLRRPFSVHRAVDSRQSLVVSKRKKTAYIEILYKVVGKGTELLSQKKPGSYLDIIGPLGNGFRVPSTIDHRLSTILIAGGMGVAPLFFLAEKLGSRGKGLGYRKKMHVIIGAKTKKMVFCTEEFKKLGATVQVATEDGSSGFHGLATDLLKKILIPNPYTLNPVLYACGPKPMLSEIAKICKNNKIPCQVSLEEKMACGVGACLGCATETKSGYKMVCKDGPVFDAEEVVW